MPCECGGLHLVTGWAVEKETGEIFPMAVCGGKEVIKEIADVETREMVKMVAVGGIGKREVAAWN